MAAADQILSLLEAMRKAGIEGDVDFLKEAVELVAQADPIRTCGWTRRT